MATLKIINSKNKYHDDKSFEDVLNYITSKQKTDIHLIGWFNVSSVKSAAEEMAQLSESYGKLSGVRLRHFIISFPKNMFMPEDHSYVFAISKDIAKFYAAEYQIVFAVHINKQHIHTHFVFNAVSYRSGMKYKGQKSELYRFMRHCNIVFSKHKLLDFIRYEKLDKATEI